MIFVFEPPPVVEFALGVDDEALRTEPTDKSTRPKVRGVCVKFDR
mgnify:CR=1 FL=1